MPRKITNEDVEIYSCMITILIYQIWYIYNPHHSFEILLQSFYAGDYRIRQKCDTSTIQQALHISYTAVILGKV